MEASLHFDFGEEIMHNKEKQKTGRYRSLFRGVLFGVLLLLTSFSVLYLKAVVSMPGELTLVKGKEYVYNFNMPFIVKVTIDGENAINIANGLNQSNSITSILNLTSPVTLKSVQNGNHRINLRVFGLLPLQSINVSVVDNRTITACGNTIGVKLKIDGIMVIGMSDVETEGNKRILPVKDAGIKPGDLITEINGEVPSGTDDLIEMVQESKGNSIKIKFRNASGSHYAEVTPVKGIDDNKYHIGLWVRENTAGIGTLTFYDHETGYFGALGHGITDIDTGSLMPVRSGEIIESSILAVKKSKQGYPGELKGMLLDETYSLGELLENTPHGIFGVLYPGSSDKLGGRSYPIGVKADAKPGPASIMANVSGNTTKEYSIEITRILQQDSGGTKGMVIKITDPYLLDLTGGIVQGMSGSPIIQNGRIIGAVTHVLINDPTRGYGIFIENMIKHLEKINDYRNSIKESA